MVSGVSAVIVLVRGNDGLAIGTVGALMVDRWWVFVCVVNVFLLFLLLLLLLPLLVMFIQICW